MFTFTIHQYINILLNMLVPQNYHKLLPQLIQFTWNIALSSINGCQRFPQKNVSMMFKHKLTCSRRMALITMQLNIQNQSFYSCLAKQTFLDVSRGHTFYKATTRYSSRRGTLGVYLLCHFKITSCSKSNKH